MSTVPERSPRPRPRGDDLSGGPWAVWERLGELWERVEPVCAAARASEWFWPSVATLGALLLVGVHARWRRRRRTRSVFRTVPGKPCEWWRQPGKRTDNLQRWVCRACGVDAFTSTGKPPVECKRNLREAQL
ncbi:hypothetical protein [Rhodovulum sp. 12E13]|uniref:hypothetical protein n=1 Tax=Rhodovulum sp. 12E13 TaxID=2203891 RepID=UPI0011C034C1|nr:hypothetical protein [Rhodovulum sp. 12E13]